jgi:hypothetical protein
MADVTAARAKMVQEAEALWAKYKEHQTAFTKSTVTEVGDKARAAMYGMTSANAFYNAVVLLQKEKRIKPEDFKLGVVDPKNWDEVDRYLYEQEKVPHKLNEKYEEDVKSGYASTTPFYIASSRYEDARGEKITDGTMEKVDQYYKADNKLDLEAQNLVDKARDLSSKKDAASKAQLAAIYASPLYGSAVTAAAIKDGSKYGFSTYGLKSEQELNKKIEDLRAQGINDVKSVQQGADQNLRNAVTLGQEALVPVKDAQEAEAKASIVMSRAIAEEAAAIPTAASTKTEPTPNLEAAQKLAKSLAGAHELKQSMPDDKDKTRSAAEASAIATSPQMRHALQTLNGKIPATDYERYAKLQAEYAPQTEKDWKAAYPKGERADINLGLDRANRPIKDYSDANPGVDFTKISTAAPAAPSAPAKVDGQVKAAADAVGDAWQAASTKYEKLIEQRDVERDQAKRIDFAKQANTALVEQAVIGASDAFGNAIKAKRDQMPPEKYADFYKLHQSSKAIVADAEKKKNLPEIAQGLEQGKKKLEGLSGAAEILTESTKNMPELTAPAAPSPAAVPATATRSEVDAEFKKLESQAGIIYRKAAQLAYDINESKGLSPQDKDKSRGALAELHASGAYRQSVSILRHNGVVDIEKDFGGRYAGDAGWKQLQGELKAEQGKAQTYLAGSINEHQKAGKEDAATIVAPFAKTLDQYKAVNKAYKETERKTGGTDKGDAGPEEERATENGRGGGRGEYNDRMHSAGKKAGKIIGYVNVGTFVEVREGEFGGQGQPKTPQVAASRKLYQDNRKDDVFARN